MLLDIHTHRSAPYPEGVVSLRIGGSDSHPLLLPGQRYSAGIHPWDIPAIDIDSAFSRLEGIALNPQIAAIGECGIDLARSYGEPEPKGGPLWEQIQVFRAHVKLSEAIKKPMIIHCVKADDVICGLRRDLHPTQPWVIHGYRGKSAGASLLLRAGCHISFGEKFNPDSVRTVLEYSPDRILAETDESSLPIPDIIARLDVSPSIIASNTEKVLGNDF